MCVAEAQQPANITLKDKSAWRKSNLNQINNINEKADVNARTLRRLRSRTQMDCPPTEVSTTDAPTKDTLQVRLVFLNLVEVFILCLIFRVHCSRPSTRRVRMKS